MLRGALARALQSRPAASQHLLAIALVMVPTHDGKRDLWCQIVADASGRRVLRPATREASSLGAAMCAACGAGWFTSVDEAAKAMASSAASTLEPDPARAARYAELLAVYRDVYLQLRSIYSKLAQLDLES
jgi:xylulokinase